MYILAFDHSLRHSAGIVFSTESDGRLKIVEQSVSMPHGKTGSARLAGIRDWILKLIEKYQPHVMCRELHQMKMYGSAALLNSVSSIIDLLAYDHNFVLNRSYGKVHAGQWKKFITGKGNLKKDTAYLIHINKQLKSSKYIVLPEDYNIYDDNIGDAICIGITCFVAHKLLNGSRVSCAAEEDLAKICEKIYSDG